MKANTSTIARTAVLGLALINQILSVCGKAVLPISDEQVEGIITMIITVLASLWTWWKNNSFTKSAIQGDQLKDRLKNAEV